MRKFYPASFLFLVACMLAACAGSLSPAAPSAVPTESKPIVYYYLASPGDDVSPPGSVTILSDQLVLSPAEAAQAISVDPEANLRAALEAMIHDPHNQPVVGNVTIGSTSYRAGHIEITLQGEVYAAGDIVLIAVRMMILLTVFSDPSIETAVVRLNGRNIVNLGESFIGNVKPEDYSYTRTEIDQFMKENAAPKSG